MKNYTYAEDVKIELTGAQFEVIKLALAQGVDSTIVRAFPEKRMYINTKTGKEVKSPKPAQLQDGSVVPQINLEATFSEPTVMFNDKITQAMIDGNLIVNAIHQMNIQNGVAVEGAE